MKCGVVFLVVACAAFRPLAPKRALPRLRSATLESIEAAEAVGSGAYIGSVATAETAIPEGGPRPGATENDAFECDASVAAWAAFQRDGPRPAAENLRRAAGVAASRAAGGPRALAYWAGHAARTAYFVGNALAGTTAFDASRRLSGGGPSASSSEAAGFGQSQGVLPGLDAAVASRLLLEAMLTYEQDFEKIEAGLLVAPWDMTLGHRQNRLSYSGLQTLRFLREATATLGRRAALAEPRTSWPGEDADEYPSYYLNDFHYQSDGWLSERSANVYETSTETLFVGRQDAMQRQTLVPLARMAREPEPPFSNRTLHVIFPSVHTVPRAAIGSL